MLNYPALHLQTHKRVNFCVDSTAVSQVSLLLDAAIHDLVPSWDEGPGSCYSIGNPQIFSENLSLGFLSGYSR